MAGNIENYLNVDAQSLAQSYAAMRAATAGKAHDFLALEQLRHKRRSLAREAAHNFGDLFSLEGDSKVIEDQRFQTRKRLAALHTELEEHVDPVPEFNGYFTRGYQKAALALAQKPEATEEQREEASIIEHQNRLIAEKRFNELPKPLASIPPEKSVSDEYFRSYLNDASRRRSADSYSSRRSPSRHQSETQADDGWFKKTTDKLSSAWKSVKGWFRGR